MWPLEAHGVRKFAEGLQEILVVEEKRQIMEYALQGAVSNWRDDVRPRSYGKFDERDNAGGEWSIPQSNWLLPAHYELSPAIIAKAIATRLEKFDCRPMCAPAAPPGWRSSRPRSARWPRRA